MTFWFSVRKLFGTSAPAEAWPPPYLDDAEADRAATGRELSPVAMPVHVLAGSAVVRTEEGRLLIERPDEPTLERPLELVSVLHVHGWARVTGGCIAALLAQGTPILWRSAGGYPIGVSTPLHRFGLKVRQAQYKTEANGDGVRLARSLVEAKIVNMRGVLRRRLTARQCDAIGRLAHFARKARHARDTATLLGVEGAATAQYFAAWPRMIGDRAGEVAFTGRSKRPPRDAVNTLLSYLYAVLLGECLCAVVATGLDARQGFLHVPRPGRPSLALDLMEPFRPIIGDRAVLAGLNRGRLNENHFTNSDARIRLTDAGRRLALELLENRLVAPITIPGQVAAGCYRDAIALQARQIARALTAGKPLEVLEYA
jgi:CRISPR-associated endonuclease Cas1